MDEARLARLRAELIGDPASVGYASVPIDPDDAGAQHVGMWALLTRQDRRGTAMVDAEAIIAQFTPAEWAAAKGLLDPEIAWWRDRLMSRRDPIGISPSGTFASGMSFLIEKGAVTSERAAAIVGTLSADAPMISRADEIGVPGVTTSEIADALRS